MNKNIGLEADATVRASIREVDIERLLVWTYRDQKADIVAEHGVGLHRIERAVMSGRGDQVSMTADSVAMVGNPLRGSGGASVSSASALHADAEAVHDVVKRLPQPWRGLVIQCARTDSRPNWGQGLRTRVLKVEGRGGKPEMIHDANKHGIACKVHTVNHPEYIKTLRNEYLTWWQAMVWVAQQLRRAESLTAHRVSLPAVSYAPWKHEEIQLRRHLVLTSARMFG